MKVSIIRDRCVGAGRCVVTAPEVFDQDDDDGIVVLLTDSPAPAAWAAVLEAADLCPGRAIRVTDDDVTGDEDGGPS
jgi:ferredoxin